MGQTARATVWLVKPHAGRQSGPHETWQTMSPVIRPPESRQFFFLQKKQKYQFVSCSCMQTFMVIEPRLRVVTRTHSCINFPKWGWCETYSTYTIKVNCLWRPCSLHCNVVCTVLLPLTSFKTHVSKRRFWQSSLSADWRESQGVCWTRLDQIRSILSGLWRHYSSICVTSCLSATDCWVNSILLINM